MHKDLKRFGMEGEVGDDADFPRLRAQFETYVLRELREAGYAPILGFGPFWSTTYDVDKDKYKFLLSMHGIYVGRRLAWQIEGMTVDGEKISRNSIPPNKSKPSSSIVE